MLQGEKVNNSSLIEISDKSKKDFYGYNYLDILNMDFRKSEGRQLLKKCGLSSSELKKLLSQDSYKIREIKIIPNKPKNLLKNINNGDIKDISILKKYSYKQIKDILKCIKLDFKGKKDILIGRLSTFVESLNHIRDNIDKLVLCQKLIKGFLVRNFNFYKGPSYLNRKLSVNDSDFYTCSSINSINPEYFFSYKDKDGFIYSYDIRSFSELLKNECCNPYTNMPISSEVILRFDKRMDQINNSCIVLEEYKDDVELTEDQKFDQKVLDIFQRINQLGHYSHSEWFTKLSSKRLKVWYKEAEDIFNYRTQLSESEKMKIIPDNNAFKLRVSDVYKIPDVNKKKLQDIVLNEIDRFISLGNSKNDRYTGSLYMLTAFTMVSMDAAIALPWLCQYE